MNAYPVIVKPVSVSPVQTERNPRGGAVVIVSDSFTRANNAATLGNADTGQAWTAVDGTWGINGNAAYIAVDGATKNIVQLNSTKADCTVGCPFLTSVQGMGILVRYVDASNYFLMVRQDATTLKLFRNQVTVFTEIGTATLTFANSDAFTVGMIGTGFSVKQNGVTVISATDSFQATATRHGLANATGIGGTERYGPFLVTVP